MAMENTSSAPSTADPARISAKHPIAAPSRMALATRMRAIPLGIEVLENPLKSVKSATHVHNAMTMTLNQVAWEAPNGPTLPHAMAEAELGGNAAVAKGAAAPLCARTPEGTAPEQGGVETRRTATKGGGEVGANADWLAKRQSPVCL